jgi:hypothetical protein
MKIVNTSFHKVAKPNNFATAPERICKLIRHRLQKSKQLDLRHESKLPSFGCYTVIDNGADRAVCGKGARPIECVGKVTHNGVEVPLVNFITTYKAKDKEGITRAAVIMVNNGMHIPNSETIIPPNQIQWNNIEVDANAALFGGGQTIKAEKFEIPLWWNGETLYFHSADPIKEQDKSLPVWELTAPGPYSPRDYVMVASEMCPIVNGDASPLSPSEKDSLVKEYLKTSPLRLYLKEGQNHLEDVALTPTLNVRTRRFRAFEAVGHNWKRDQLLEWEARLGYVPETVIKKTFLATTQLVPSVQHENELFPSNSHVARFPILRTRRLNETVYADLVEYKKADNETKVIKGLLIYGSKSKLLAYYWNPDDSTPTSLQTLEWLYEFIRDFGAPHTIYTDGGSELKRSKKWRSLGAHLGIHLHDSEPGKHESNHVERAWQDIQQRHERIMAVTGVPKRYRHDLTKHLCDLSNHTAHSSINWRTPMETVSGDTPDISVFRFRFWEQVWYRDTVNVTHKQQNWVKGRMLGIAWTTGDCMCYCVVPDGSDSFKRKVFRSIVIPRHPDENAPRETLKLPSDYFFPTPKIQPQAQPVGSQKRKPAGTQIEQAAARAVSLDATELAEDANNGVVLDDDGNEPGTVEKKLREEYLESSRKYNEALNRLSTPDGATDAVVVEILGHHEKGKTRGGVGELFFRCKTSDGTVKASLEDIKVDAPFTLARYIKRSKALYGQPKYKLMADKILKSHEAIMRATQQIEDKLGLSMSPGEPMEGVAIRRTPSRKPAAKKKRANNAMGSYKYGVYVPRSVSEALSIDKQNGNHLWQEAVTKEIKALMDMKTFKVLTKEEKKNLGKYQFAPLQGIFDIKQDGRRKYRLVLGE